MPLERDYENKCTWITHGVGGKGGEKTKQKQTKKGGRVNRINLLQRANSSPPLKQTCAEFAASTVVEFMTHVNNVNDAGAVNLGGRRGD
jgi:hypothetical protein